jgi:hypothetical protein
LAALLWTTLFCVLLTFLHELGHAAAAKLASAEVHAIVVSGLGGACLANAPQSLAGKVFFYSGGIIAQLLLLAAAALALLTWGAPKSIALVCATFVFVGVNVFYLLCSLVPHKANDAARIISLLVSSRAQP